MKATLRVIRTNGENGISKVEQEATYRIGKCSHTNARKAEKKVLSSKYRGVFAKLSWVNNPTFNSKTALLKSGDILILIITPASEDAAVTFAESERKTNGEKMSYVLQKKSRPVSGKPTGEPIGDPHNFTAANDRIVKSEINKNPDYKAYTGQWHTLPFDTGCFKMSENGQTIIELRCLGKAENSED